MTLKISTLGGGSGQPPIIIGLIKMFHDLDIDINAVVGTWDSGGSSGKLRDLYGVMPPGDILKCIMAFVPPEYRNCSNMLLRRFDSTYDKIYNHNAGNLLLTSLQKETTPIAAIRTLEKIVNANGNVYPITETDTNLKAEMTRVKSVIVDNEHEIGERLKNGYKITKLWLDNEIEKSPALDILERTDVLVISPGSIFTSIMPHFTIDKIRKACRDIPTKIICANFVERTLNAQEFIDAMNIWTGIEPTHAIFNSLPIEVDTYKNNGLDPLVIDCDCEISGIKCISRPIIKKHRRLIRHDPKRTAAAIFEILSKERII